MRWNLPPAQVYRARDLRRSKKCVTWEISRWIHCTRGARVLKEIPQRILEELHRTCPLAPIPCSASPRSRGTKGRLFSAPGEQQSRVESTLSLSNPVKGNEKVRPLPRGRLSGLLPPRLRSAAPPSVRRPRRSSLQHTLIPPCAPP